MNLETMVENYMTGEPDYDYDNDRESSNSYQERDDEIDIMFS